MNKEKLAELVLQKMQKKKQKELQNRPHLEILRLLVKFQVQDYWKLQEEITILQNQIKTQRERKKRLQEYNQQFQNTGKKPYPRIIIKPEFIASEHVEANIKQFYRKTANTFLREDLLRKKQYEMDVILVQRIKNVYKEIREKENEIAKKQKMEHKQKNEKRIRNLKQELKLKYLKEEQQNIRGTMEQQKKLNQSLLNEYEIKKTNLNNRIQWSEQLIIQIQKQKKKIQQAYNPNAYRDYLKKIFGIRTKNQAMIRNLNEANKKVAQMTQKTSRLVDSLIKNHNCFIQGKLPDSSSKKRRSRASSVEMKRSETPRNTTLLFNLKKSIFSQPQNTPSTSLKRDKSNSKSLGKTTASSMSNLIKNRSLEKSSFSMSMPLSEFTNSKKKAKMFDQ